jgi:two-component system, OmpR family, response regulator
MEHCIVVIEDERDILQLLHDVLGLEHYHVIGVSRPNLVHATVETVKPDLFLIDVMLPGTSGVQLAEQLRASGHKHTPMIAMSASKLMSRVAVASGMFQEAIDKPFDLQSLLACIERHLSRTAPVRQT